MDTTYGDGSEEENKKRVHVSHVTLEPRKEDGSWSTHVATFDESGEGPRGLKQNSHEENGCMFAWFSLILPNYDVLQVLPQKIVLPHEAPMSNQPDWSKRTLGNYKGPPTNIQFATTPDGPSYFQFDVWASDHCEFENLEVSGMNYLEALPEESDNTKTWKGRTNINLVSGKCGISIIASTKSGHADYPCILLPQLSKGSALFI